MVAGGESDGEAEGEEDAGGAGEEHGGVARTADDGAGDGAGEEQGEIDEGVVGAERGAAIFDGDVADGLDSERRKDQRITNADQSSGGESGTGNASEAQQKQAEDFHEERDEGDRKAAEARDQPGKEDACDDEASSIERKRKGSAGPMQAGEVKRDECGQNAKTNAAESENRTVRSDAPEDMREGKMPRRGYGNARQTERQRDGSQRDTKNHEASGREAPMLLQQNAERRSHGERAEGGHAIPGNDFCDVLGADAPDSPHGRARADHAFTDTKQEASEKEKREACERGGNEKGGGEGKEAAGGTSEKAEHHDALGAENVDQTPDARTGENGGDILGTDDESREDCAIAEPQVDVHRKNGERDADGEVADESERDGGKDLRNAAAGKFGGARRRSGFRERIGGGGGGGVGHREESDP